MVAGSGPLGNHSPRSGQWSVLRGRRQVHQARRVEQLHEPLVGGPRLRRREVQVLVEHGGQAPLLQLPQASDDAASPVLASLAVDEDRLVSHVKDNFERLSDRFFGDVDEWFLRRHGIQHCRTTLWIIRFSKLHTLFMKS